MNKLIIFAIFLFFLFLLFIPITTAELTIEPEIVDTYFLYSGMGENQTSKHNFYASHDIVSCEMIPQNDLISCIIEEGYIIEVWFTTVGEPYIGKLQVSDNESTSNSTFIVRTHDFGSYSEIPNIPVGSFANSTRFNIYFNTDDGYVNGIKDWLIWWTIGLFAFAFVMSMRRK